jgi:DNA-binding NarL/FixJ family response regulator
VVVADGIHSRVCAGLRRLNPPGRRSHSTIHPQSWGVFLVTMQVLRISPWERGVLEQLASGAATSEIARQLGVHDHEIEASLATLFVRMGVASRAEAIAVAARRGLLAT